MNYIVPRQYHKLLEYCLLDVKDDFKENEDDDLVSKMNSLDINPFTCGICGAKYKETWTLKSHMVKKMNVEKIAMKNPN